MEQIDVIIIVSFIIYSVQYYFEKNVYAPQKVEDDPYWSAIYGTGEFSPDAIKERKKQEEEKEESNNEVIKSEEVDTELNISTIYYPPEVSTDTEADDFIRQLQNEFGDSDIESDADSTNSDEFKKEYKPKENNIVYVDKSKADKLSSEQLQMTIEKGSLILKDDDDDYLNVSDLDLPMYNNVPTTSILEDIEGPQQWYVVVIGMEGTYLHVSDGKKKWIDVGNKARKININDTLMLMVELVEEKIKVLDVVIMS